MDLGDVTDLGALGPVQSGRWPLSLKANEVGYLKFTLSRERLVGARLADLAHETDLFLEDSRWDSRRVGRVVLEPVQVAERGAGRRGVLPADRGRER